MVTSATVLSCELWQTLLLPTCGSESREITIMGGDELLCHFPKAEVEPAVVPFYVGDGVGLDHLQHGHIDFDPACSTYNMMQMGH